MQIRKSTPIREGVHPVGIIGFLDSIQENAVHLHNFMLFRNNAMIAEGSYTPCQKQDIHMLFSLSKSFTSTAIGFMVQEGKIDVANNALAYFPEIDKSKVCEKLQEITVRHLLTMNTGQEKEPEGIFFDLDRNWVEEFWTNEATKEPGSWFFYNTLATYILSAIVTKITGERTFDYLKERLFTPLGFSGDIWWEEGSLGYNAGGFGLNITIEDVAKFGLFVANRGKVGEKQLLNEEWFEEATRTWSDPANTWEGENVHGYGYQFWGCHIPGSFRGDGAFGQYCIILPKEKMLFVTNAGHENMQQLADAMWDHILPAIIPEEDMVNAEAVQQELERRLKNLSVPAYYEEKLQFQKAEKCNEKSNHLPAEWCNTEYRLPENILQIDRLSFENQTDGIGVAVVQGSSVSRFTVNKDNWLHGTFELDENCHDMRKYVFSCRFYEKMYTKGTYLNGVFYMDILYPQTAYQDTWEVSLLDGRMQIKIKRNTGFEKVDFCVLAQRA